MPLLLRDSLLHGARPSPRDPDEFEPSSQRFGWQHEAASRVEHHHRDRVLFPLLSDHEKALVRAQSGSGSGGAFSAVPSNNATRFEPQLFRVLLQRRLHLPLLLSVGRPLVSRGHHRAACAQAGVLGRRGYAVESAAARICREAGG